MEPTKILVLVLNVMTFAPLATIRLSSIVSLAEMDGVIQSLMIINPPVSKIALEAILRKITRMALLYVQNA